jgi:hypothetical protein
MKKVKIGSKVMYATFSSPTKTAFIEEIEICKRGEKHGRSVSSCDLDRHSNGVISLSDGHWAYFDQVKRVIQTK